MKIYIESSGCARRKLDVAKFHTYFTLNGHEVIDEPEQADRILVTTCAFKKAEEDHSMSLIEKLNRHRGKVLVYGCLPDIAPAKYHRAFDLNYLPPRKINDIDNYFENMTYKFADIVDSNIIRDSINHLSWSAALAKLSEDFELSWPFFLRSMRYLQHKLTKNGKEYFLFTSRGCLGHCTYCAVRFAVGDIRSKPLPTVLDEFRRGIDSGHRKFTMIGDDVGAYGQDKGGSFPELLAALLDELKARRDRGDARAEQVQLHLDEINPRWIIQYQEELASLMDSKHIASILCPMQSGNDRILDLMQRDHDCASILKVLERFRSINPQLILSSQIIVGFPSETEDDFDDSLQKLGRFKFSSMMLFPYDEKEKTKAVGIQPKVPEAVIHQRVSKAHAYLRKQGIRTVLHCNE
ncbi:MAG TPA: hypothetical protein DCZ95_12970 [Verrucomicrobia bacterium]|nr:MAG: hypothetical protein A2X46_11690 [Lentisphaerae bacterium GWF2_57_35]HBA85000.1 hypothetical protein [Verrucomicrobiota bacterium]